jgi:hypothetical protein
MTSLPPFRMPEMGSACCFLTLRFQVGKGESSEHAMRSVVRIQVAAARRLALSGTFCLLS